MAAGRGGGGGGASFGGNRPRMLRCYLCGQEYGTKSLPIHIPQCQKKWHDREQAKPRQERRSIPKPPQEYHNPLDKLAVGGGAGGKGGGGWMSTADKDAHNEVGQIQTMPRLYFSGTGASLSQLEPAIASRGLHSFPFHLNFSSSVHRVTQLSS
jgi:hypothetical protein